MSVVGDQMARMATEIELCRCLFHTMLMKSDEGPQAIPAGLVNMLPPCRSVNGHYQQIAALLGLGVKKTLAD